MGTARKRDHCPYYRLYCVWTCWGSESVDQICRNSLLSLNQIACLSIPHLNLCHSLASAPFSCSLGLFFLPSWSVFIMLSGFPTCFLRERAPASWMTTPTDRGGRNHEVGVGQHQEPVFPAGLGVCYTCGRALCSGVDLLILIEQSSQLN